MRFAWLNSQCFKISYAVQLIGMLYMWHVIFSQSLVTFPLTPIQMYPKMAQEIYFLKAQRIFYKVIRPELHYTLLISLKNILSFIQHYFKW